MTVLKGQVDRFEEGKWIPRAHLGEARQRSGVLADGALKNGLPPDVAVSEEMPPHQGRQARGVSSRTHLQRAAFAFQSRAGPGSEFVQHLGGVSFYGMFEHHTGKRTQGLEEIEREVPDSTFFLSCSFRMRSSMVPRITKRTTWIGLYCPAAAPAQTEWRHLHASP